jgi:hypothetical protein
MSSIVFIARARILRAHRISSTLLDSSLFMREKDRRRSSSISRAHPTSTRRCRRKASPYSVYLSNLSVDASIHVMKRHLAMHLTSKRRRRNEKMREVTHIWLSQLRQTRMQQNPHRQYAITTALTTCVRSLIRSESEQTVRLTGSGSRVRRRSESNRKTDRKWQQGTKQSECARYNLFSS